MEEAAAGKWEEKLWLGVVSLRASSSRVFFLATHGKLLIEDLLIKNKASAGGAFARKSDCVAPAPQRARGASQKHGIRPG